jgi:hypothetical protein
MIRQMQCAEWRRLLNLYAEATRKLSELTRPLADAALSYERNAFDRAWEVCEGARQLCADIRRQMREHLESHGCGTPLRQRSVHSD